MRTNIANIKKIIQKIDPKTLGLKKIKIESFKKLGMGYSNLNYLARISGKKFNCRINLDKGSASNLKNEFNNLKIIEKLNISAKPYYLSKKFMMIEFIIGKIFPRNNKNYPAKDVKNLAKTLSKLHNSGLKSKHVDKGRWIKHFVKRIKYINSNTNNVYKELLKELLNIFKPKIESVLKKHPYCCIHGDLTPQNVINTGKYVKLIDLEDLEYSDAARDLAQLIAQFDFGEESMKIFMKEYKTLDKDLLIRTKTYAEIHIFSDFLWELTRIFRLKNKDVHEEFAKKYTMQSHINEAKRKFNRLKKLKIVPKSASFPFKI